MNTPRGRTSDTGIERFGEMRWVSGNKGKRIWGNKIGTFGVFPVFFKQKALPKTLIPLVGEDRIMGNKRFAGAWKEGKQTLLPVRVVSPPQAENFGDFIKENREIPPTLRPHQRRVSSFGK